MKYCEEIVVQLEEAIKSGLSDKKSCDLVGINKVTFYRWQNKYLQDDKTPNPVYKSNLSNRLKKARAEKCKLYAEMIKTAGIGEFEATCPHCNEKHIIKLPQKQWQAIAWLAERTEFDEFGARQKIDSNIAVKGPIEVIVKDDR